MRIFADHLHPEHLSEEPPRVLAVGHCQGDVIESQITPCARLAAQRL